jgi:hypothetical protein
VKDTQPWVETDASQRDSQLTRKNAVKVVQDSVCRGDGVAGALSRRVRLAIGLAAR